MKFSLLSHRPVVRRRLAPLTTACVVVMLWCVVAMLTACTSTTPQPTPAQSPTVYSDPFAYCAAVGTVDVPNEQYGGPAMPEIIVQGMIQQGIVSADAPLEFQQNAVWRCMDGQVWVCHFGANLPCLERADTSREPTPAMESFCQADPVAESIPAAVTGRATVYEWRCNAGRPEVSRQVLRADAQGYLADFWYALTLPKAAPADEASYRPPAPADCQAIQDVAARAIALPFALESGTPFSDPLSGESGQGCTLTASGTGADLAAPYQVVADLMNAFSGWSEQPTYRASGPTGEMAAIRRDRNLMLILVEWTPAPGVECPTDQPISACDLRPEQRLYTVQIQVAQEPER